MNEWATETIFESIYVLHAVNMEKGGYKIVSIVGSSLTTYLYTLTIIR